MAYANPEDKRAYNKRANALPKNKAKRAAWKVKQKSEAPFVAIDSEGFTFGEPIQDRGKIYRQHKTFLWAAGDKGGASDFLYTGEALGSVAILEWLLSMPKLFGPSIFVSFAFGYDAAQIVADLPYEKLWELQRGKPFDQPDAEKNSNRVVFWKNYGFQYIKGKKFVAYKFAREGSPYKETSVGRKLNPIAKILIYDVFGFFQSSFVKAAKAMPGAATEDELNLIIYGKKERAVFQPDDIKFIKKYTSAELVVLSRMMTLLRESMQKENIKLRNWFGAGSIAQALLRRENVKEHYPEIKTFDPPKEQLWAHHAFFGGRIELIKQGNTRNALQLYDIASAYPAVCVTLPSMRDGKWNSIRGPSFRDIERVSILSIVQVRTRDFPDAHFYPFPFRLPNGSILFPREVHGYYMIEEVRAAFQWAEKYKCADKIELIELLEFLPSNGEKPFAFVQKLFDYRKSLPKSDITQIVIKLGINSIYGKQAQGIGGEKHRAPPFANPWYAAAITAGTRARLLQAALTNPSSIVMLATDGIVSQRRLPLSIPTDKTLGAWEYGQAIEGGCFVQSGVYCVSDDAGNYQTKSRGYKPTNVTTKISAILRDEIPILWRDGKDALAVPYTSYMTIGQAVASREAFVHIGRWCEGERVINLESAGRKRKKLTARRADRAEKLVATAPNEANFLLLDENGDMILSAPHTPEWLDMDAEDERAAEADDEMISARFDAS